MIAKLNRHGIVAFAVSLRNEGVTPGLENIGPETGGRAFTALTPQTLRVVFDRIDQMHKVKIHATKPEVIDFFDPFLLPAAVLLAAGVLALFGLCFTPW